MTGRVDFIEWDGTCERGHEVRFRSTPEHGASYTCAACDQDAPPVPTLVPASAFDWRSQTARWVRRWVA